MRWLAWPVGFAVWLGLGMPVWADHIPSAREGLGPYWWGLAVAGPVPLLAVGVIALLLYRAARRRRASR